MVVIAAHDLPAGTRLSSSDLRETKLSADPSLLAQLVPASSETSLLGRRLAQPATGGVPLARASIAAASGGPAVFTLAVAALHAVGGDLQAGDRVSVLATFTSPTGTATTRVVARALTVLSVGQAPTGLDPASATVPVTVALPNPAVASQLALANNVAKIDLLRDGSNETAAIPPATADGAAAGGTP